MERKKIAIFTQNLSAGGVQKSVINLANHLKKEYEVIIILAENDKLDFYKFDNVYKIQTPKIDIKAPNIGEWLLDYRIKSLDEALKKIEPKLLISFEDYNNIIALSTKYKCKKIVSSRVSIKDGYTKNIHLLTPTFYLQNIKKLYTKASKVICVAGHIKDELARLDIKVELIYNGISLKPQSYKDSTKSILCLGRLHPQKGQADLIKAYASIACEVKQDLVLVGDGELKSELEALALSLGIKSRVKLMGFMPPEPFIRAASFAVMPSYYEGFSNSALEIMAANKPLLAYDYAGATEIFNKDDLIKLGDIKALAKAMLGLANNEQKRKELAQKQYEKVKDFDIIKALKKYEEIIKEVLNCVE